MAQLAMYIPWIYSVIYYVCIFRWHFAYKCVMEETVIRRKKMWSWAHIKDHRDIGRQYKISYKKKLTAKKVPNDVQKILDVRSSYSSA